MSYIKLLDPDNLPSPNNIQRMNCIICNNIAEVDVSEGIMICGGVLKCICPQCKEAVLKMKSR